MGVSCPKIEEQSNVSDPTLKVGLEGGRDLEPALTRRLGRRQRNEMLVEVERECIGTVGCESKSHALRCAVKQSCEVGAVPHMGNLSQRADGHLTREGGIRPVTYPERGFATRGIPRGGSYISTTMQTERGMRDSSQG